MSITVDIFIKFNGSKGDLLKILASDFLIRAGRKEYWFFNFIEFGLSSREEDEEYFTGHRFRPYNFVLWGTTHAWSSSFGTARYAHSVIMDTLAQMITVKLNARTMICVRDWGEYRRYHHVRPMKRNKFCTILDEKTKKPPKEFFNP